MVWTPWCQVSSGASQCATRTNRQEQSPLETTGLYAYVRGGRDFAEGVVYALAAFDVVVVVWAVLLVAALVFLSRTRVESRSRAPRAETGTSRSDGVLDIPSLSPASRETLSRQPSQQRVTYLIHFRGAPLTTTFGLGKFLPYVDFFRRLSAHRGTLRGPPETCRALGRVWCFRVGPSKRIGVFPKVCG